MKKKCAENVVNSMCALRCGAIDTIRFPARLSTGSLLTASGYPKRLRASHSYEHLFGKIISALQFHPNCADVALVGSRAGDIAAVKMGSRSLTSRCDGDGRGRTITDIKFDSFDCDWFYVSSVCGKIVKRCVDAIESCIVLKDCRYVEDLSPRFSCLDMSGAHKLLITGDHHGFIHLIETESSSNSSPHRLSVRLHKSNIMHCEFNARDHNIFVTASIDCTAKVWDIRMISADRCQPLATLSHQQSLNSATFSPTDGSTLLTTNYCNEICCYRGPNWTLERRIRHSHQQSLRQSPIKPKWHPFCDLFLIGSSSVDDYDKPQALHLIDSHSGHIKANLTDDCVGVMTINCFNCNADMIGSTRGQNLVVFEQSCDERDVIKGRVFF